MLTESMEALSVSGAGATVAQTQATPDAQKEKKKRRRKKKKDKCDASQEGGQNDEETMDTPQAECGVGEGADQQSSPAGTPSNLQRLTQNLLKRQQQRTPQMQQQGMMPQQHSSSSSSSSSRCQGSNSSTSGNRMKAGSNQHIPRISPQTSSNKVRREAQHKVVRKTKSSSTKNKS